jgi:N-glycosylase/DNA lyase
MFLFFFIEGFGYRSKYISETASFIRKVHTKNPEEYLVHLRDNMSYRDARKKLITDLPGVGQKVSDCVCLMSLNKHEAIPVDTHIHQVAENHYKLQLGAKKNGNAISFASYNKINSFFRDLHGEYAGWAQSILFSSNLKRFKAK